MNDIRRYITLLENIDLTGRVYYHVSPLPRFTANRSET